MLITSDGGSYFNLPITEIKEIYPLSEGILFQFSYEEEDAKSTSSINTPTISLISMS